MKLKKFIAILSLLAVMFLDIDARRPGLYGDPSVPRDLPLTGLASRPTSLIPAQRISHPRIAFPRRHRKGVACRRETGVCRRVKVTGGVTAPVHHAVVCRANVCRRATVTRHPRRRGGGGFSGGGIYRGPVRSIGQRGVSIRQRPSGVLYTD